MEGQTLKTSSQSSVSSVDLFAVQCDECFKWRLVNTKEEYEDMRSKIIEEPFYCHNKPDTSCEDPADIEYDATRTWVVDKPNIPKTPEGFERKTVVRKDFSKLDAHYTTPTGKRVRSITQMSSFLEANPKYREKDISLSNFNFGVPKIMEDTLPENVLRKKRTKTVKGEVSDKPLVNED